MTRSCVAFYRTPSVSKGGGFMAKFLVFGTLVLVAKLVSAEEAVSHVRASTIGEVHAVSTGVSESARGKHEDAKILTDSKLRADDGSLSKWSFKGNFSYSGPTIGNLGAADLPNPSGKAGNYRQRISGSFSNRYRISPVEAVSFGTGLTFNHPFHGLSRTDVNNPFFSYDRALRSGNLQMRTSPGITIVTAPDYAAIGEVAGLSWINSAVYNVGSSGLALSLDTTLYWWYFNREIQKGDRPSDTWSFMWIPGFKYNFSDGLNVYTNFGLNIANPRSNPNKSVLLNDLVTWRAGASYAYGRDIYIAPYVQTYTDRISSDSTTINFSVTFNLL